ncbi:hypothetical protein CIB48_g2967 [Xylaria polymorpha]|nr:hypothetical protein CIB48_g2967 [Xylaria polymorpha]
MMPTSFSLQDPGPIPPYSLYGRNYAIEESPHAVIHPSERPADPPSKRPADEDDDEIQFISERPVKRRRMSEKQPAISMSRQPMIPLATDAAGASNTGPNLSMAATPMPSNEPRDTERRLSTGMGGVHAGAGDFVLDQPFRKPRPSSPPELSPKQLPSTVSPAMLNIRDQRAPGALGAMKPSNNPIVCQTSRYTTPCQAERPTITSELTKATLDSHQTHILVATSSSNSHSTPSSSDHGNRASSKSTPMPPPPSPLALLHPEVSHGTLAGSSPRLVENHHHHNISVHSQKHPCQVCSQLRHQVQLSRAQGLPMVNATPPPHFIPQLQYHTSYGQHVHPQMLTMPTGNVHQYSSNFTPVMIPVNGNPFVPLSHPPPQPPPQQSTPQQQKGAEKDQQTTSEQPRKPESPQISQLKNTAADTGAISSPIKPPASLIQPTYRKPSPNLIVDVAETCQEKFPFEEVAKRHNVPVDKVFDVFAAIIQVPLLRCPTDRRRAGRLATARIKEYNKAKKDIIDSRADKGEVDGPDAAVDSTSIAQRLGRVEFPDGFNLGGKS